MSCVRPITAFAPLDGGPVLFHEKKDCREIRLPCGKCIGCRVAKQQEWTIRCLLESKCHKENVFLTLTYNEDNFPPAGGLVYRDFQLFAHRLRKKVGAFRFFVAGEYGENYNRPHFHALLFGLDFHDKRKSNSMYSRDDLYQSVTLDRLWGKGFASIGAVTHASARYTAAYCISKRDADDPVYDRLDPSTGEVIKVPQEFCRMSLKPGIGNEWLKKHWFDVYGRGHNAVIVNGEKKRIPRYFHKALDSASGASGGDLDWYDFQRYLNAVKLDHSPARLAAREEILISKQKLEKARHV